MRPTDSTDAATTSDPCWCGHPKENHADCGIGPCRTNVSLALWHNSNDRKSTACRCRSYHVPVETQEVK